MSRRHTSRHVEAYEAEEQVVATVLPWWYATPMPEPWERYLWHQWGSAWAELSLEVCHQAYRKHGARLYATHRDANLRDDLQDWLIVRGVEAMADFLPDPDHPAPHRQWAAFLHRRFDRIAPQHFGQTVGRVQTPSGSAAVDAHNSGIRSTQALEDTEAESGGFITRHPLHGEMFETADPAHVLIRMEELAKKVADIERESKRAGVYTINTTAVGQTCLTLGCDADSIAKGLCRNCYNKNRRKAIRNCKEPDCVLPVQARGLCSTHYQEFRDAAIEDGTWQPYDTPQACSEEGCPNSMKGGSLGRCRTHYEAHKRATAPPCTVDGCDLRGLGGRGMCSTHWRRWKRTRDAGEGEAYIS